MKKWIFALMLVAGTGWGASPVTLTVGAGSSGAGYTSFATAYAAATSADTIKLLDNSITDEGIALTHGVSCLDGNGFRWGRTTALPLINFSLIGISTPVTVKNFIFDYLGGTSNIFNIDNTGVQSVILNNKFSSSSVNSLLNVGHALTLPSQLIVDKNTFNMTAASGTGSVIYFNNLTTTTGCFILSNNIIKRCINYGLASEHTSLNKVIYLYNNTFTSCPSAVFFKGGVTAENNVFCSNSNDVTVSGNGSLLDFSYSAFGQLPSGAGTGCIYGITAANSFVNPSPSQLQDFIPRHDSPIARSGINIPGVTTDILGNPYHNPPSMGAIQCPTSGQDWFYETFQEVSR